MEVVFQGQTVSVSYLEDDSVDTVRQRLGAVLDRHPDTLLLEVEVELPKDAYENPRDWEALFFRLARSASSKSTDALLTKLYTDGRVTTGVPREDWAGLRSLQIRESTFREKRILGVEMPQSLVLPTPADPEVAAWVPSARIPLPQKTRMFKSIHPETIVRFHATEVEAPPNSAVRNVYTPFWTTETPSRLPPETLRNLQATTELLRKLMALPAPKETAVRITRARWQIPWISTDWGMAVRNRFEQILFGMTLHKDAPYIGLFTNREYGMQHKFWVPDPKTRETDLKPALLAGWLQFTRPQRDRPTLLLFRGDDRSNFDRLAITATSMTVNIYRAGQSKTDVEALKKSMEAWIQTLDALLAFVDPSDLKTQRWELLDVSADVLYDDPVTELDTRRLPCLSSVFLAQNAIFRLLRADKADRSLSDLEVAILRRLRENLEVSPVELAEEMHIAADDAGRMLEDLKIRIQEDKSLVTQELDVMPRFEMHSKKTSIQHAEDLPRILRYANLLRYVLTGSGDELDQVCPPRSDVMPSQTVLVAVAPEVVELVPEDPDLDDAFAFMGSARPKAVPKDAAANYVLQRLRAVDPDTFDENYSKKCELKRQPIIMTPAQVERARIKGYDVEEGFPATQRLNLSKGLVICPEYWCMTDEIPLRYDQLVNEACPVCEGELRLPGSDASLKKASVLVRDTAFKYPGYLKDVSKKNQQAMPCCYQKEQSTDAAPATSVMDAFYIMNETKRGLPAERLAFLPAELAQRLRLDIRNYSKFRQENSRLKDKTTGVFRVGLGRPSETLAGMLDVKVPRPRDAPEALFLCNFVRTWRKPGEDDGTFEGALRPLLPDAESRARMARLMAGVDAAYEAGRLTTHQELEYVGHATRTQIFRVNLNDSTVTCGLGGGERAVAILETDATVDVMAYASHVKKKVEWVANLYMPRFTGATLRVLEKASADACAKPVPVLGDGVHAAGELGGTPTFIVDPTGYAQAVWSPGRYILPISPDQVPKKDSPRTDYSDIAPDQLPSYSAEKEALELAASESHPGFAWKRDHYDVHGRRVEIETVSGFRAPVIPEEVPDAPDAEEVMATLRKGREQELVEGDPNPEDAKEAADISYRAEVLDYLLFTLSKHVAEDHDDGAELREAIEDLDWDTLEPPLWNWYSEQVTAVDFMKPEVFVKKVRVPCDQYTTADSCKGVCGLNPRGKCRVKVDHGEKDAQGTPLLFKQLMKILLENAKLRAVVLDGRASPFFSSLLYLELPHERFMTDAQIRNEKSQGAE